MKRKLALGILEENGQYVESYRELMSFEDEIPGTRPLAQDIEIRFEHVSFTYPCSDREVLHDLNLTIRKVLLLLKFPIRVS